MAIYTIYINVFNPPTAVLPIANPAPFLAAIDIDGAYISKIAKTQAAVNAIAATSFKSILSEGIYLAAKATAPPSNKYFIALFDYF